PLRPSRCPVATKVIIQSLADYSFAQLLTSTGVSLVADEPVDEGGDDLGPTPYQLLAWALGSCTAMTLQWYARRKNYPLEEVAVQVIYNRSHVEDCKECEDPEGHRLEHYHRNIVVRGPLDDAQR